MEKAKLDKILRLHKLWFGGVEDGVRADFSGTDLRGADFRGVDLCGADLRGASLRGADLWYADLRIADLQGASLCDVDLRNADLQGADLRHANLQGADIRFANLYDADLEGTIVDETTKGYAMRCPAQGSYIAYKKCRDGLIVELEIPADAKRSSATTNKCRASKAKVLSITRLDGSHADTDVAYSQYDETFAYRVGETVEVPDFDEDRWNECSTGIHHFMTRDEAVEYF